MILYENFQLMEMNTNNNKQNVLLIDEYEILYHLYPFHYQVNHFQLNHHFDEKLLLLPVIHILLIYILVKQNHLH